MGDLILVRHGQASFGADDYDKLSALGHQQSRWLGEYLAEHGPPLTRVVRGALRRHRETAEGILDVLGDHPVTEDARLDEFHYFPLEQEYLRETGSNAPQDRMAFMQMMPEIFTRWDRGVFRNAQEPYAAFDARVKGAIDDALETGRNTLVVTSGGVIAVTLRRILELSAERTADLLLNINNASVHWLRHEGGRLRLVQYNGIPHLDPHSRAHARTYV